MVIPHTRLLNRSRPFRYDYFGISLALSASGLDNNNAKINSYTIECLNRKIKVYLSQKGFESPTPSRLNTHKGEVDYEQRMLKLRGRARSCLSIETTRKIEGKGEKMLVSW